MRDQVLGKDLVPIGSESLRARIHASQSPEALLDRSSIHGSLRQDATAMREVKTNGSL
jgi:hypothetical protein